MKRYKLLKDLPTFNAGDEFYIDNFGSLRLCKSNIIAYASFTLEKFPNILTDWFEEIHEYKRRRVEIGDLYYFIDDSGNVTYKYDYDNLWDNYRHSTGNYGLIKEELEAKREYDIARQILLDDAEGGKWKKDGTNLYVYYDYSVDKWIPYKDIGSVQVVGAIYFQDEKDVQKSLEEHEEQWKIVRKYEMGE